LRIALISCTSRKKAYKCPARDLYSESPRFRLAYALAKLVADKIFILSAKYGLVPEDMIIEPYNETLKDKSAQERRAWGDMVLNELRKVSDLERDEFIVLAGEVYQENLLPHLVHFWLPLKGKRQGEWIPELERLITLERESDKVIVLHMLFNGLPRLRSYGDNSTITRSPGSIRIKFIRILPDMWARTLWPFSSSTLNMAFGSGSITFPSTSITSSLLAIYQPSFPTISPVPFNPSRYFLIR
jgi:hypothetical protein